MSLVALDFRAMTARRYTRKPTGGFMCEQAELQKDEDECWRMGDLGQKEILESFRRTGK